MSNRKELVNGVCVDPCPEGKERNDQGVCVDRCPDGKERNDQGVCVDPCPEGKERNDQGVCVDPCPIGQELVNGACVDPCPSGQTRNDQTGSCECPGGQILCPDNSCKASFDLCDKDDPPHAYNCPKELIDALNALLLYLNSLEPVQYSNTQIYFDLAVDNVIEAIIDCDEIPAEAKKSHSNKQSCNKNLLAQLLKRIERSKELDPYTFGAGFLDLEALRDNLYLVNTRCNKKKKEKKGNGHNDNDDDDH